MKKILSIAKIILYILLLLLVILFSVFNSEIVEVSFDFFPLNFVLQVRLFLVIIFCTVFGFIIGVLSNSFTIFKKNLQNWSNERKIKKMEKNINKTNELEDKKDEKNI